MSEYWVSKKKYFCKYCEIYIADDVPSRQQHENGLRHQGNRERFIRNIYKASEKKKKDSEEEKKELARIDQAANAAFAQDVSAGHARPGIASSPASTSTSRKTTAKPSNPFANYTTAQSLGYTDPDAERAAAEADRRHTQGVVGEWQVVAPSPLPPTQNVEPQLQGESPTVSVQLPLKREAEAHSDDDFDRHSKLRKRTVAAGLGEIYDPGIIPIKLKKKEEHIPPAVEPNAEVKGDTSPTEEEQPKQIGAPKWVKVQWKQRDEPPDGNELSKNTKHRAEDEVKDEGPSLLSGMHGGSLERVKTEDPLTPKIEGTSEPVIEATLFKKRKTPASTSVSSGRGRRQF